MLSSFAPGRLELIGNHTDYNEGFVLAFAINLGIALEGETREDGRVRVVNPEFGETTFALSPLEKDSAAPWVNYVKGVLLQFQQAGAPLGGFEMRVRSDLPAGAGMSSSAAIEVATALLVQKLFNFEVGDMENPEVLMALARLCRAAENDFVGMKCGILDQATSLLGKKNHAILLDCRTEEVETVPLHPDFCFVVCHTGAAHALLSSKYNARRTECQDAVRVLRFKGAPVEALRDATAEMLQRHTADFRPQVFQRAMHVVTENTRVLAAREAMRNSDMPRLGRLLGESHESSRDAFENSTPYLDRLVEIARGHPACLGARLTGGGFGGATLNLVARADAETFADDLASRYRNETSKEPRTWIVEAGDGAR
ncbi:MAG: galactokinase [Verrucomicrobiae bacterium]|nr:galactokinase [Verrucomicrobiae bacterium]